MSTNFLTLFNFVSFFLVSLINGLSIDMIPIDTPDLNIVPSNLSFDQRNELLINITMSRALNSLNRRRSTNAIGSQAYRLNKGYYVTKLAFGDSTDTAFSPYLLLDTLGDQTWVQCEGCNPCFQVRDGSFPYARSKTYTRMPLSDSLCLAPKFRYDGSCGFTTQYVTSTVTGFLGRDRFYFKNAGTGVVESFPNIAFGCGLENQNVVFWGTKPGENVIAGVHGIAVGPRSFITQLDAQINQRFSYCLPPYSTALLPVTTIFFGPDAQIGGDATYDVKTISMYNVGPYHLYANGISVDGHRLPIDPTIFELGESGNKGFFIDSASPYTGLPRSAYNPLRQAMVDYFDQYGWRSVMDQNFDLCYNNYPNDQQSFPSVIIHFSLNGHSGEVDMELGKNMFLSMNNSSNFCMAVMPVDDSGPTLFGAFQQRNFKFLFDVYNGLLSFVPQNCVASP